MKQETIQENTAEGGVSHGTDIFFDEEIGQIGQKKGVLEESDTEEWLKAEQIRMSVWRAIERIAHPEREDQKRTKDKKRIFLDIYKRSMGTITLACEKADIVRDTFYRWRAEDDEFSKALVEAEKQRIDMTEDRAYKLIQEDDGPTIRWYLERVSPKYKAKQILEHHTDERTMEDVVDRMMERIENGKQNPTQNQQGDPEASDRGEHQDQK